ncbi:hypothetical protein GCM10010433_30980 [Streptomyces pulveraceus]
MVAAGLVADGGGADGGPVAAAGLVVAGLVADGWAALMGGPVPAVEPVPARWGRGRGGAAGGRGGLMQGAAGQEAGQASVAGSETLLICLPPAPVSFGSSSAQRFLTCDI